MHLSADLDNPSHEVGSDQGDAAALSIVRYLGWDTDGWSRAPSPNQMAGLYTRLELYAPPSVGGSAPHSAIRLRSYDQENRSWFERLFESETDTVTTLANVEIRNPALNIAIPLFSVSHASGRDLGNTWVTNFTQSNVESPLFLIGPNTALIIHLKAQASQDLKSQAAASVIGAVTQAVQIAAPTSQLLTTLSKPEVNNAATAIDTTISNLYSKEKSEDVEIGRFADSWRPGNKIVLSGCAPFVKVDGPVDGNIKCTDIADVTTVDVQVGTWILIMRCPQVSAFDSQNVCKHSDQVMSDTEIKAAQKAVADRVSNGFILQYALSSQTTVQSFVQSQSWYTAYVNSSTKNEDAMASFCGNAMSGTTSLPANGLSDFDAALVLRAIIDTAPGIVQHRNTTPGFQTSDGCKAALGKQADLIGQL
ncbi:MAG: hypothetical protein JOZ13_14085 [Alphaproteobacteria bacterium]|nr:hypothetical protein [Alphaproteobacteria bacterium]